MILPKFIAVRAYLESRGIAFANIEYIQTLFDTLRKEQTITAERGQEILGHKTDTATSVFRLFEHIGIMKKQTSQENELLYSFSNIGSQLMRDEKISGNIRHPIIPFFLTWLPFKLFIKYLQLAPGSTVEDIYQNMGRQVENYTKEYSELIYMKNVDPNKGVAKPFNRFVISNSLATIGNFLGLTMNKKKEGPYELTPIGKYVAYSIDEKSFSFNQMDKTFGYNELAMYDFFTTDSSDMVIISNPLMKEHLVSFIEKIQNTLDLKNKVKIEYRELDFQAILTKNKAYWETSTSLLNISYDSLRVLELNANIVSIT